MTRKPKYEILKHEEGDFKTFLTTKFKNRKEWESPDQSKLYSFIPGTILDIFVKKGQNVNTGDELLILEAMKMRNRVVSSVTGKIKAIHVKKNQIVPKDFLLIEFDIV